MRIPTTLPEIGAAIREVLGDQATMSREGLLAELQRRGFDLGVDPADMLEEALESDEAGVVLPLADERVTYLPALLDGRTFTHRLTAPEVAHGYLQLGADLRPLEALTEDPRYERLRDGSPVIEVLAGMDDELLRERGLPVDAIPDAVWLLAPGALRGRAGGDLVGVAVRPDGFELGLVTSTQPPADLVERLTAAIARAGHDEPAMLDDVVWELCADDQTLFTTPLPPLRELLDEHLFVHDDDQVAAPGFDLPGWRAERQREHIQRIHGIDGDAALAVLVLKRLHENAGELLQLASDMADPFDAAGQEPHEPEVREPQAEDDDGEVVHAALEFLAEPGVAEAVAAEAMGTGRAGAAALGMLAESLEARAPRRARPGLRWLRGKALDRLGDALQAEDAYHSVLALDPEWPPALFDLARIASDRGDAGRGLALLRRADARPDDELVVLLQHFRPVERTDIGRNEPCWCGSGRKYKVCHRNREQLPLAERAAWLYQKSGMYVSDGPWRGDVLDLAAVRSRYRADVPLWQATQDPTVMDVLLFEGGAFEAFLGERGPLLPDDERLLGEQWLLAERSLYEIEDVTPGSGFRARDLRTGDRVDVRERAGSTAVRKHMLVCARFVPAGETIQCFGGMEPVQLHERDALLDLLDREPEPQALVEFLSARFAPPELRNTEGDPMVQCEATLRSAEQDELAEALDETYERDGAEPRWHDFVRMHGMQRVRGIITLDGAEVTVEANSERRFDLILDVLRAMDPELQVLRETRQPVADVLEAMERAPAQPAVPSPPADPRLAAALEQFIRQHEQAWLDESIPALSGATPREAAADPSRREDLVRLLASFPPAGGPGQMGPDRLRAALSL
ncbi:SEC-C metal-binding domain-containing protein [Blastococcus saxobsidens]|uniref:SEC-C motif-containing protein n=1 Tax=Blastococcus saxobsidens (strain DD2) TaxID=1146883 RepID=H6RJV2_BLASD|nr:SEC-C metal-binding domain-containing protein [Blastococcus saxobsidens]CCG03605.1 Putative uncharacterized protein [Blastococcus saxobsidens DD2]